MMNRQQEKQLKVFGYGMPLILAILGARHGFKHSWDTLSYSLFFVAVIFLTMTLFSRPLLVKAFKLWMKIAHTIGLVITGVVLILLYYFIFTPISCILKLRGKDFMCRQWGQTTSSYWLDRNNLEVKDPQEYTKQF